MLKIQDINIILFNSRYSSSFNERSLTYIINLYSKFLHEEKNRKD